MIIGASALADEFTLADYKTGERFGHFTYSNGSPVSIYGRILHIERIRTKASELEDRMKNIIIPALDFRQASISDVLQYLSIQSSIPNKSSYVSIIPLGLCVNEQRRPITNSPSADVFSQESVIHNGANEITPAVTLSLRNISLYDALSVVCEVVGLRFKIDDRGIVLVTPDGNEIRAEDGKDPQCISKTLFEKPFEQGVHGSQFTV
jgi:hypothetical protein